MTEHYQLTLNDYLSILRRRWLYLLLPFLAIFGLSVAVAMLMPPVYQSVGTILVESQQIPDELIKTTITSFAEERIQLIKQRVMTRSNLLKVIDKFNLFAKGRDSMTVTEIVDAMREGIEILPIKTDVTRRQGNTTLSFTVAFEDSDPQVAYQVANELVTLFLNENVRARTLRAAETTEFLTEQAEKLKKQLEISERQLADYKQEHQNALPEHIDLHMKMLERTETAMSEFKREIKSIEEERRFLDIELSSARSGIDGTGSTVTAPSQELTRLKTEYAKISSIYGANHPDVRSLRRQIQSLKKEVGAGVSTEVLEKELLAAEREMGELQAKYSAEHPSVKRLSTRIAKLKADILAARKGGASDEVETLAVARVRAKINAADERIKSLKAQIEELKARHGTLEKQILLTPQVQRGLTSLARDYENTLKKYKEIQNKQMEAKLAESLEEGKKAERFSLLEPPLPPEKPIKPNRKKMMALGFFLALAGSGGLVMMLESIDQRIRGSQALTALLRHRPLVVIPYLTLQEEIQQRKRLQKILAVIAGVALLLALVAIHFFYMPLDLLMLKIVVRLGG